MYIRKFIHTTIFLSLTIIAVLGFVSCDNNDEEEMKEPELTGDKVSYDLNSVSDPSVSGIATFEKRDDNSTVVTLSLDGTSAGDAHPAHIHMNTAAEGGGIMISLTNVDGASGESETIITQMDDGTAVTYDDLVDIDGYINVHLSSDDLATLVAQGDVGQNALTGNMENYVLFSVSNSDISGEANFKERVNGETLVEIKLDGTSEGGDHPAHIHANTAVEGGGIAISLSNVDGASGESKTNVAQMDDETAITYNELLEFDGYINVHLSGDDLATLIAQGDVGQNALTGETESYELSSVSDPSISGMAHFKERKNEETLVEIKLDGTSEGGDHPSHIHANTAVEGGGIAISLTNVGGASGESKTNVAQMDDETAITYSELIEFDGYINVHLSGDDLGTLIAQGDVGQNALTGEMESYELSSVSDPSISGMAHFKERKNEETLVEIKLDGTSEGGDHPAHIHANTAVEGGGIAISLTNVDGASGESKTNVTQMDDETVITYSELIEFNGYINVHLSADDLATLIAQGDVGQNALTGNSMEYDLASVNADNISGSVKFEERKNETTLVTVTVNNTIMGNEYPNHIHENSVDEGGGVAISLNNINGDTGLTKTQVDQMDDETAITYSDLIEFNGHVKVHDPDDIGIIVAEGDIGANAN